MDGGGFGLLMDLHAMLGGAFGQTPDHGVMANDAAGGVEHGAVDGEGDILGDVQRRHQLLGFLGVDEVTLHAVKLGGGDGHAGRFHGRFAVHQVQVAAVVEHQVEVQLFGQAPATGPTPLYIAAHYTGSAGWPERWPCCARRRRIRCSAFQ
jgi:hypothetical protein